MILTTKQELGLKIAVSRYKNKEKYTVIAGYAGVGKTTLVKIIIDALDINPDRVAYATYTGKAAEVLRQKNNPNACTLHKLLYDYVPKQNGGFIKKLKKFIPLDIVVVDEVSIVPKEMIDVLLKFNFHVLFLGDPFQLPQIVKEEDNHLLDHPHIFLDEIMRQEKESEIIRLTMQIRNHDKIEYFKGQEVQVLSSNELSTGMISWADVILCATNRTRHNMNNQKRILLGYEEPLVHNEQVIVKQNYWDCCDMEGNALVNGTIATIQNPYETFSIIPKNIRVTDHKLEYYNADLKITGGDMIKSLSIDKNFLNCEQPCLDWQSEYQIRKNKHKIGDIIPKKITYGYSLTCHAAQGSEFDKVLVIEERFPFDEEEHARWLYTACSRSISKLVLVR